MGGWRSGIGHPVLFLLLGGAIGTYCRYVLGSWVRSWSGPEAFPWGTLIINIGGSFLLGLASVLIPQRVATNYQPHLTLLLATGFCGGFTTFSTFSLETFHLVQTGRWVLALFNALASVIAGFVAVVLGVKLGSV